MSPMGGMGPAAAEPDAFMAALSGWQAEFVPILRAALHDGAAFDEAIKWGNLVFLHGGLTALIRVEEHRVILGFWRGKRLREIEPRVKASGRYELGNWIFRESDPVDPVIVTRLAAEAARLNDELGDPTARH